MERDLERVGPEAPCIASKGMDLEDNERRRRN